MQRRQNGEDNNEILSEDEEGTEIYILSPTLCNSHISGSPKDVIALWEAEQKGEI